MEKLIITAAICGAEVTKKDNPNVPYTAEEIAAEAKRCYDAGASIIHLHVRNDDGTPTQSKEVFKKNIDAIRAKIPGKGPIIQPSTGGAVGMKWQERIAVVELNPEMATLDCGTTNFGDDIFVNDLPLMRNFAKTMIEHKVLPELECFEPGHIANALILRKENLLPGHMHFDIVLGVQGSLNASVKNLLFMVELIPPGATWTVAGIGRHELPLAVNAITMDGHVRVGFEDNIFYSKGVLATSSAQLVERIVKLSRELGRDIATAEEARAILEIK